MGLPAWNGWNSSSGERLGQAAPWMAEQRNGRTRQQSATSCPVQLTRETEVKGESFSDRHGALWLCINQDGPFTKTKGRATPETLPPRESPT